MIDEEPMPIQTSYTQAREHLATLLDKATADREIVIIQRRGKEDVALIAADELAGLIETAHLLRSTANTRRLLEVLARVREHSGTPQSLDDLRREVQIDEHA
jgi:antitoxin YefM